MVGWHHQLSGRECEQAPGDGEGQACCSPRGGKESDTTEGRNDKRNIVTIITTGDIAVGSICPALPIYQVPCQAFHACL